MRALLRFAAMGVAGVLATLGPAHAQNYESNFQVRSGVFGQWGLIRGDAQVPNQLAASPTSQFENFAYSSLAVGFSAGFEYVRRETWSYGIEIDGGAISGEERIVAGPVESTYTPNYIASLRLRAGRHVRPDVYVYGTLGVGVMGAEIRTPSSLTANGVTTTVTNKVTGSKAGIALGFGVERDFGPGLWFAEYLFNDYGALGINARSVSFDPSSHALRVGIKFKVGYDHYHDDVLDRIGRRH
jgi:opacity protein-like surface antigen